MTWTLLFLAFTSAECQASAELHYTISGGHDDAYEDAIEACNAGMTFTGWRDYQTAYEMAGRCETPTSWAERGETGWFAVCGDADGREVGRP